MVGRAIQEEATSHSYEICGKSSKILNFLDRNSTFEDLLREKPDLLVIAAARVGGILDNMYHPVDYLSKNLQIQTNLIDAAFSAKIKKVIFLGSSCVYPKFSNQPIQESELLSGRLEETNEAYAIAKISGIKLIEAYKSEFGLNWFSVMPTNLYGPFDNFSDESSHVIPGLISRFHNAKQSKASEIIIWGDGTPLREFLYTSDLAKAIFKLINLEKPESLINIGSGVEISIRELASLIGKIVGFQGSIIFDNQKPNGTPRKLLNSSLINSIGWIPEYSLEKGLVETYNWFLKHYETDIK